MTTQIVEAFPSGPIEHKHVSTRAGMGYVDAGDGTPWFPRTHLDVQVEVAGGMVQTKIVFGPTEWAELVSKMIEYAGVIGGDFEDRMQEVLTRQRPRFN